jgi:hypothetical protein
MNDAMITLPGGAMVLAADVLVTRWHESPEHIAELQLTGGKVIVLKGHQAERAMDIIKKAHDVKAGGESLAD